MKNHCLDSRRISQECSDLLFRFDPLGVTCGPVFYSLRVPLRATVERQNSTPRPSPKTAVWGDLFLDWTPAS